MLKKLLLIAALMLPTLTSAEMVAAGPIKTDKPEEIVFLFDNEPWPFEEVKWNDCSNSMGHSIKAFGQEKAPITGCWVYLNGTIILTWDNGQAELIDGHNMVACFPGSIEAGQCITKAPLKA